MICLEGGRNQLGCLDIGKRLFKYFHEHVLDNGVNGSIRDLINKEVFSCAIKAVLVPFINDQYMYKGVSSSSPLSQISSHLLNLSR